MLHILGPKGEADPEVTPGGPAYVTEAFVSRMDLAYGAADAVLCRAGSNTVTEVSGVGLPAIYVPLPIGNGEQAHNARPVVDAGGGLLVSDAALTPEWVRITVPDSSPTRPGSRPCPRRPPTSSRSTPTTSWRR